jgi:predicted DNA-binding protein (MmcQ/YjbR family)
MLEREDLRAHCLSLPGAYEDFPFGPDPAIYKVAGKLFALLPLASASVSLSLKCDPTRAVMLRDTFAAITPGYHLNKRHWNSIRIDGTVPDDDILELIEHSYALVVAGLTRRQREQLDAP